MWKCIDYERSLTGLLSLQESGGKERRKIFSEGTIVNLLKKNTTNSWAEV